MHAGGSTGAHIDEEEEARGGPETVHAADVRGPVKGILQSGGRGEGKAALGRAGGRAGAAVLLGRIFALALGQLQWRLCFLSAGCSWHGCA